MPNALHSLIAGAIFGIGLTVSGMVNPQKILNFLDFSAISTGGWDPTLAFVFAGALAISFAGLLIRRTRIKPIAAEAFREPDPAMRVDLALVGGAATFGLGWGLTGLCPGPALSGLALAGPSFGALAAFVAAMAVGMAIVNYIRKG